MIWKYTLSLALVAAFFTLQHWNNRTPSHCLDVSYAVYVCVASDMARVEETQRPDLEHPDFDLGDAKGIRLHAARNETIAFQLIVRRNGWSTGDSFRVAVSDLTGAQRTLATQKNVTLYEAWYHAINDGGHKWGGDSEVLPWPGSYPDVLIPELASCDKKVRIRERFKSPKSLRTNSNAWIDFYVPRDQKPGNYQGKVTLALDTSDQLEIPLALTVWDVELPAKPSIDAVGELYRSYALEGASKDRSSASWRTMAHCYQQLAHRHRMIFLERFDDLVELDWPSYRDYAGPILDGSLFTPENGYHGTGQATPVHLWRTPWEQDFNVELEHAIEKAALLEFEKMAEKWREEVLRNQWHDTRYFAYIFDEIVGRTDESADENRSRDYLLMAHNAVHDVQQAIDKGAQGPLIDLIWTTHTDADQWSGDKELDFSQVVRFWAPNAGAANSRFLAERRAQGQRVWFYHDGHPAIGAHNVNSSGIEMRNWGVVTARYNLDGHFMWALNLGQDDAPFRHPNYLLGDDRYGNGVLVYPGNQLPKISYPSAPGPLPSMRLKAWRRGLQDAELVFLARKKNEIETQKLLEELVPIALADARVAGYSRAQWSRNPADWIDFHQQLLALATGTDL